MGFNLRQKIEEFEDQNKDVKLNREVIVRSVSFHVSQGKEIGRAYILTNLSHDHFTTHWDVYTRAYKSVHDFLRTSKPLIHPTWMPYENMMIPLIAFAVRIPRIDFSQISQDQFLIIKTWYWLSIFSRRYSSAAQTYALEDGQALQKVATNDFSSAISIINRLQPVVREADDLYVIQKKYDAVYKGILNFLSFASGGYLNLQNNNLASTASNLEDHHIFPYDFLKKNWSKVQDNLDQRVAIDCVVNRTLIPKLNNINISNKPPSKYLGEIRQKNTNINVALSSHFLSEDLLKGDYDQNYEYFLAERADRILGQITEHVLQPREALLRRFVNEDQLTSS